jgi:hypothetical protein
MALFKLHGITPREREDGVRKRKEALWNLRKIPGRD